MNSTSSTSNTQQNIRQAADGMLHSADQAIDSTRNYANRALDVTEEKIHSMSSNVRPTLEKFSRKAEEYAHQGMDMAMQAKDKARDSLSNYSAATGRYVADKPMQSVLIAAAVGAAVAIIVTTARNRNRY